MFVCVATCWMLKTNPSMRSIVSASDPARALAWTEIRSPFLKTVTEAVIRSVTSVIDRARFSVANITASNPFAERSQSVLVSPAAAADVSAAARREQLVF